MRAPAEEQIGLAPFFESSNPACGSPLLGASAGSVALKLGPPLSGRPIPPSQADVTIRLPAGYPGPQSPGLPTKANGTAWIEPSELEKLNAGAGAFSVGFVGGPARSHAAPRYAIGGKISATRDRGSDHSSLPQTKGTA